MSIWNKTSNKPQNLSRQDKRNVIATDIGWVRRITYTDVHGNSRRKDEILVAIDGLANTSNMGIPEIDDVWSQNNAVINTPVNTWISFNEPITTTTKVKVNIANTAGGGAGLVASSANTTAVYGGNKLLVRWTPTVAGSYKVSAQTVANGSTGAINVRSANAGTEAANLVISAGISNNSIVVVTAS